jgi:hypothetical protein
VTKESDQRQIVISIISQIYLNTYYFIIHLKLFLSFIFSQHVFSIQKTPKSTKITQNPRFFIPSHPFPRPAMADVADPAETAGDHIAAGGATPTTSAPSAAVEDDVVEAEESPTNPQEKPTEAPS